MLVSRMTLPRRLVAILAFLGAATLLPVAAISATGEGAEVFTVRNVEVDVTAGTAAAAREQAIRQAQREAFARLFDRLTPEADGQRAPPLDDGAIEQLVDAFEVEGERTSAVRYIGRFTIRFRPQAVRTLMLSNGIRYAEVMSKPVLVLPVDQTLGQPILWQRETPWRQTWEQLEPPEGLVPVLVPYGELQDVTDIGAEQALAGDQDALRRIADRYGAGAVAVVQAAPDGELAPPSPDAVPAMAQAASPPAAPAADRPRGLAVLATIHRFDGNPPETAFFELPPPSAPTMADPGAPSSAPAMAPMEPAPPLGVLELMPAAVERTVDALEQSWIAANLLETGQQNRLTVEVPFAGMEEWAETRRRLSAVPTVTRARIVSLSRSTAELDITFLGDPARLRTALAQRDLVLTEPPAAPPPAFGALPGQPIPVEPPVWRLQWRGAASLQAPSVQAPSLQAPPDAQAPAGAPPAQATTPAQSQTP